MHEEREYFSTTLRDAEVITIPAFDDNYLYMLVKNNEALVVDPGEADAILEILDERDLKLSTILITHDDVDHIDGIPFLKRETGAFLVAPERGVVPRVDRKVRDGDTVEFQDSNFRVIETPGHAPNHIVYFNPDLKLLFSGDVLFVGGCGRLRRGTADEMWASLQKIKQLPDDTTFFCGHEYALDNYRFGLALEPHNQDLKTRFGEVCVLREKGKPAVPSTLGLEKKTNPFLRVKTLEEFASLRQRKDHFG